MATDKDTIEPGSNIEETLQRLGHNSFRPGQREAIERLLAGHDLLVVLPTASGKSLIYQIAALHLPGVALVISPLIALMQDQVDSLQERGVPATFVNSSLSDGEQVERMEQLLAGDYKILYVTPERLRQEAFYRQLRQLEIGLLAIDEAHSISEWGYDFRPDYLHIRDFRHALGDPLTLALTATATRRVREEVVELLGLERVRHLYSGSDRPNIRFAVHQVAPEDDAAAAKRDLLADIFRNRPDATAIVYTGTRNEAEEVAALLRDELQFEAEHYHAGLSAARRAAVQDAFLSGDLPVVAATNAFGMGIDRPDVRLVLHYRHPDSIEAYYQEAGRAGRDGEPAEAILLYDRDDRNLHDYFIRQNRLTFGELSRLYEHLTAAREEQADAAQPVCIDLPQLGRRTQLYDRVRVALERLEQAGVIHQGRYEGNEMQLRPCGWDEEAVRQVIDRVDRFIQRQTLQLEEIIAYAENSLDCRRALLLQHFGDETDDEVSRGCCDICEGKLQVADFVAEIEEAEEASETEEAERTEAPPPLRDSILACTRAFDGLRTPAQMLDLLHGDENGYNRFRHSDYHGRLAAYPREAIHDEITRLIAAGTLAVNELETLTLA